MDALCDIGRLKNNALGQEWIISFNRTVNLEATAESLAFFVEGMQNVMVGVNKAKKV